MKYKCEGVVNYDRKREILSGLLYQPGDPELVADREETVKKLYAYNNLHPLDREARSEAIKGILGKVGKNCVVEQPLFCTYGYNTTVGDNFFLNVNGKLMDSGKSQSEIMYLLVQKQLFYRMLK